MLNPFALFLDAFTLGHATPPSVSASAFVSAFESMIRSSIRIHRQHQQQEETLLWIRRCHRDTRIIIIPFMILGQAAQFGPAVAVGFELLQKLCIWLSLVFALQSSVSGTLSVPGCDSRSSVRSACPWPNNNIACCVDNATTKRCR
jgi:hypothetical protein